MYTEDDGHDLSDLGIGTSSTKSSLSEDCDTHSLAVSTPQLFKYSQIQRTLLHTLILEVKIVIVGFITKV